MTGKWIALVSALKKITLIGATLSFAMLLASCRPMYGPTTLGNDTSIELAAIDIAVIPGRTGQQIRNELVFLFTGGDQPVEPNYKLEIAYRASVLGVLFTRTDDAAGQIYSIDATYTLRDKSGKTVLIKGKSHARAGYDKLNSTFSNIRAERNAQNRAAKDIARDINTRIAAYISSNS